MRGEGRQRSATRHGRLPPTLPNIVRAGRLLAAGELVAFPTETVYGLGADATNPLAVAKLFAAKGRPRFNPLIAHIAEPIEAAVHGRLDRAARRLAESFWPGPLTLVVPFEPRSAIADLARAGLETVALRVPGHPVAHAVLAAAGRPVAAPSANRSGRISPTRAEHVEQDLGGCVSLILDDGATRIGLESTVVSCLGGRPRLLRPGGVTQEAIEAVLGEPVDFSAEATVDDQPSSPGRLASHYAPRATVRLNATSPGPGEALLAFGSAAPQGDFPVFNLSPSGDLVEAASRLFEGLRALDSSGVSRIAVMPIPEEGLGVAVNDRLRRAAAPRE